MSSFWARRKAGIAAEAQAEAAALRAAEAQAEAVALAERSDEDLLDELDLPDPDTLDTAAELRRFLTDAVPARLRARALRRMWRLNPVLANLDGLVDYGEDFNAPELTRPILHTAYEVGRGFRPPAQLALAEDADPETAAEPQPEAASAAIAAETPAPEGRGGEAALEADAPTATPEPALAQDEGGAIRTTRRMRIRFHAEDHA